MPLVCCTIDDVRATELTALANSEVPGAAAFVNAVLTTAGRAHVRVVKANARNNDAIVMLYVGW